MLGARIQYTAVTSLPAQIPQLQLGESLSPKAISIIVEEYFCPLIPDYVAVVNYAEFTEYQIPMQKNAFHHKTPLQTNVYCTIQCFHTNVCHLSRHIISKFHLSLTLWLVILLEGNLLKPGDPYILWTKQPTTDDQATAEELNYSGDMAWWHPHAGKNLLEAGQYLAIFGGRPIGSIIWALLTKVVNHQCNTI
jgi:hypothetical protein